MDGVTAHECLGRIPTDIPDPGTHPDARLDAAAWKYRPRWIEDMLQRLTGL